MHRFFVNKNNIKDNKVSILGEDVKHIKNVLRLDLGDIITVCNGEGLDYTVRIDSIEKDLVLCDVVDKYPSKGEPPIEVWLYQGLPKATKMDLIIQKVTELGVNRIVPVITDRTVVKIEDKKKEEKKLDRWNRIAEEAAKQSKRGTIPIVDSIISFNEMVKEIENEEIVIVPYENENKKGLKEILPDIKSKRLNILIGPEGGFTEEEIEKMICLDSKIVSLGPRILRTETAGFTVIAIVLYELGDLGVI